MFRFLPKIVAIFLLVTGIILILSRLPIKAASDHVVISEIQTGKTNASTDEFVELYNPKNTDINLSNWKLTRKTSSGTESILISTISGTIKSHGFFLLAHPTGYTGTASADQVYSENNSITSNNTVLLYSNDGTILVDKVGFGNAIDREETTETDPSAGTSRERRANGNSTPATMFIGGIDELIGNGEDTDNNANDFVLRNVPQPQNSLSIPEPVPTVMPSDTSTPNPLTPTDSLSPTPTVTLMPSRQPTTISSPTPTVTASPTPTGAPLPTNALTITPSVFPSATVSPAPSLVPTTRPVAFPQLKFVCTTHIRTVSIFSKHFDIRIPFCHLEQH